MTNAAADQTTAIYRPQKGERVSVSLMKMVSSAGGSTATWSVGDGGLTTRYVSAETCVGTVGDLVDGLQSRCLYTSQDTINVLYTKNGAPGATAPRCAVMLEVWQSWPVPTLQTGIATPGASIGAATETVSGLLTTGSLTISAGREQQRQGADVASANNLTLGTDGNQFLITGAVQINLLDSTGWQNGSIVRLYFGAGPITIKHGQTLSTTFLSINLLGSVDFVASLGSTLTLQLDVAAGTRYWHEIGRMSSSGRFQEIQGADVPSANQLTLGNDGNFFHITGTTRVDLVSSTTWQNGALISFWVPNGPITFKHAVAQSGVFWPMSLSSGADFVAAGGASLTLRKSNVSFWIEMGRKA